MIWDIPALSLETPCNINKYCPATVLRIHASIRLIKAPYSKQQCDHAEALPNTLQQAGN
jgi:hypothetical protein